MAGASVNGIRLHVEEHGRGDPILLIHGTSSSAMVWGRSVEPLSELGRVIAYDRRGCTRSDRPVPYERTSVSEHADDAAALLEAVDAVPAIVIGRSYGGEIGLDLALRFPDRVRALVLLEAALLHLTPESRRWEEQVHRVVSDAAGHGMDTVAEAFIGQVLGPQAWEGFSRDMKRMLTENGPAIVAEFEGGPLELDLGQLETIEAPSLLLAASGSPDAFREVTDRMADAMPKARKAVIGGGHFVDPATPEVLEFVREILCEAE
jgi:pimeloyl-ACP methyl ester carboxylesterase